jgi:hypothetical protein
MAPLKWPHLWQSEAIEAATPYVDADERLDILVGDPQDSLFGTRLAGHLYRGDDDTVMMIFDRSGRRDIYPWRLLSGPVLAIRLLRPRTKAAELFRHPEWKR